MNKKATVKMCIDIAMTAALPVLMCYSIVGETAHEIIGVAMFCLFILHHILNFGWIKGLFKGSYSLRRAIGTAVNALVFICMIGLMYSGIVISKHVFTFIQPGGAMTARTIHMLCAYWGLVLMSIHLGMHISAMAAKMKLRKKAVIWAARCFFAAVAAIGGYEFISLGLAGYMSGQVQFAFFDPTASAVLTICKYLSVMILFAYIGYLSDLALKAKAKGRKPKKKA